MSSDTVDHQQLFDVLRNRGGPAKVYGRKEELGLLQDAYDRVSEDECQSSEVVLVHGPSGCGKSAIVKALQQWTKDECSDVKTFFGSGKYDQLVNNEPFAAIVAASNELCTHVLKAGPKIIKRFNDRFNGMVDGDATILSNVIPALAKLLEMEPNKGKKNTMGNDTGTAIHQNHGIGSVSQSFIRFKQLWRSLLLAISCCSEVTVLFLDDVQWADSNSLDLIHSLIRVTRARNILIVCAFRDDATVEKAQQDRINWCFALDDKQSNSLVGGSHLSRRLCAVDSTKLTIPLTNIGLQNLDESSMEDFVTGLLYGESNDNVSTDDTIQQRATELSRVVASHTDGNAFFALH